MPIPPDPSAADPLDGPEADRLLRAARGQGDDPVMTRVGRALRDLQPADAALEPPPVDLWERIESARTAPSGTAGSGPLTVVDAGAADATMATVVPLHRRRWFPAVAAAAAVVAVVGVAVALSDGGADEEVVAVAQLDALQGSTTAVAQLRDAGNGELQLDLDLSALGADEGEYLEVWLLRPDVSGLVSLGPVHPDGVYEVPPGLDPNEFPVVDVSFEPIDGDPAHSGNSVLRGPLDFAV